MRLSHQDDPLPCWAVGKSILENCSDQSHLGVGVGSISCGLLYIVPSIAYFHEEQHYVGLMLRSDQKYPLG